jgi:D-3-phosphoglycerate dehydrogenase
MNQILVADKIAKDGVEFLKDQEGFEVIEAYGSSKEQIIELAANASAIIVRSETKIDAEVIQHAPKLKAVGRAGVGVDNIDIEAATERGIVVVNTPGGNTIATAELAFTHMLCAARPIAQADRSMKAGKWERKSLKGVELMGKTLAILGLGRIGSEVSQRAQAFGMKVIAYDPFLTDARAKALNLERVENLDDLWPKADYITVHMPLTEKTRDIINDASIAKMKDGVRLINCARGGLINQDALVEAIKSGKVAAAGIDVFDEEPLQENHPMRDEASLVLTPHLGASTEEAQLNVGVEIAKSIATILTTGTITNAVNMPSVDAHTLKVLKPYFDLGQIMGTLVQQLTPDSIHKLTITYYGRLVDLDTMPLTRTIQKGYLSEISGANINDINASLHMKRLGIEVNVVKSNSDTPYSELIEVSALVDSNEVASVEGTVMGKAGNPRIVSINHRDLEISPKNFLLLIENEDMPGMVGKVGTTLGKHNVNIANMALNREQAGANALAVFELDEKLSQEGMDEIAAHDKIVSVRLVDFSRYK